MKELKETKFMNIMTTIGFFIGFGMIIWYSIFSDNYILPIVGVIIIFIARFVGYGIDRIIELKKQK